MRVVVADDEPLARALLVRMLAAEADVEVVGEAGDGEAAVAAVGALRPDALFLDVQMPGGDGFTVLDRLGPAAPAVVFVTAHDRHAVRAFDHHAVDYLLKPFDEERLARAVARLRSRLADPDPAALRRTLEALAQLQGRDRLIVRDGDRSVLVRLAEIESIEAAGKLVEVHLVGPPPRALASRDTLAAIEARLDPARFVRIHRSTIVHLDHVRELRPFFGGDQALTLTSGRTVTTSRGYRDRLNAWIKR